MKINWREWDGCSVCKWWQHGWSASKWWYQFLLDQMERCKEESKVKLSLTCSSTSTTSHDDHGMVSLFNWSMGHGQWGQKSDEMGNEEKGTPVHSCERTLLVSSPLIPPCNVHSLVSLFNWIMDNGDKQVMTMVYGQWTENKKLLLPLLSASCCAHWSVWRSRPLMWLVWPMLPLWPWLWLIVVWFSILGDNNFTVITWIVKACPSRSLCLDWACFPVFMSGPYACTSDYLPIMVRWPRYVRIVWAWFAKYCKYIILVHEIVVKSLLLHQAHEIYVM